MESVRVPWCVRSKTTGNNCKDDCVKKAMKQCNGGDYDFTGFNCCMYVSNALGSCGLKKLGPWPNSRYDATAPHFIPFNQQAPTYPGFFGP